MPLPPSVERSCRYVLEHSDVGVTDPRLWIHALALRHEDAGLDPETAACLAENDWVAMHAPAYLRHIEAKVQRWRARIATAERRASRVRRMIAERK